MGETVEGEGGEEAEGLFWHKNKCLWTDQKYTYAQMVSINGALVLWVSLPGCKVEKGI